MATATKAEAVGLRRARLHVHELGEGFLEQRLALGLSQEHVARAVGLKRLKYGRVERGQVAATIPELDRIAAALGLELAIRLYAGGPAVRDAAHASRLAAFLAHARPPLRHRIEVALPAPEGRFEQRAWDAMLFGHGTRTAIELEMRVRDAQAMRRRHELKRRDDPTEAFILLIADTRHNRRVIAELGALFEDLPRLRPSEVYGAMEAGRHPATGLLFLEPALPLAGKRLRIRRLDHRSGGPG